MPSPARFDGGVATPIGGSPSGDDGPTGPKGGSGYTITAGGLYYERELSKKLDTAIKRHGTASKAGEFEQMLSSDFILAAGLEAWVDPIVAGQHDIVPNGAPADITNLCNEAIFDYLSQDPFDLCRQILKTSLWHGFDFREEEWRETQSWVLPYRLHARMPWSITGWHVEGGELMGVEQRVQVEQENGRRTWENVSITVEDGDEFSIFVHDQQADDFRGSPVARRFHVAWLEKVNLIKTSIIGNWRNASGSATAEWTGDGQPPPGDEAIIEDSLELSHIHEGAFLRTPKGWKLGYLVNQYWAPQFRGIRERLKDIDAAYLVGFKAGPLGMGMFGAGSRAAGDVGEDFYLIQLQSIVRGYTTQFSGSPNSPHHSGLIRRIVEKNFPGYTSPDNPRPLPRYQITGIRVRKITEFFSALTSWVAAGGKLDDGLRDIAMNVFGIDESERVTPSGADSDGGDAGDEEETRPQEVRGPDEAEPAVAPVPEESKENIAKASLNGAQVTAMIGVIEAVAEGRLPRATGVQIILAAFPLTLQDVEAIMGEVGQGFVPEMPTAERPTAAPQSEEEKTAARFQFMWAKRRAHRFAEKPFEPRRELTTAEGFVSFATIDNAFDLGVQSFADKVQAILSESADAIAKAATESRTAGRDVIADAMERVRSMADEQATELAAFGYEQVTLERRRMRDEDEDSGIDEAHRAQERIAEARMAHRLASLPTGDDDPDADQLLEDLDDAVDAAVDEVESQVVKAVSNARAARGPAALDRIRDAILGLSDGARRSAGFGLTTTAFNIGREDFAREFGDEVQEVVVSEIMDGATCGPCREHDTMSFDFGSADQTTHQMPYRRCDGGRKCRGVLIYLFR